MKKMTGIIIGAVLIAVGVLYGLSAFGIGNISISLDGWWTLFIIIPCLQGLLTSKDKTGSAIGLCLGILLLLAARDVIGYDMTWKLTVPLIIIAIGIRLIEGSLSFKKANKAENNVQKENMAAFNTKTVDYTDEEITIAKVGAVFGGATCNLTNAKIRNGSQIEVLCVFGGADVIVPENVNVNIDVFCMFGGVSDEREIKNADQDGPTLTIHGFCVFGGAEIKSPTDINKNTKE